jgi:coproporphyrinogen dehydrogenase HemZ
LYKFYFNRVKQAYEMAEMVRMFLPKSEFVILESDPGEKSNGLSEIPANKLVRIPDEITTRDEGKRYIYDILNKATERSLKWGTLTGVRPVKMVGELLALGNSVEESLKILMEEYYLSREKAELLISIRKTQNPYLEDKCEKAISVYVGIPFCPTKCIYCSFPSYQASYDKIEAYLNSLKREIKFAGQAALEAGLYPESIYVGGGTPTILSDKDLGKLIKTINENFNLDRVKEFTVEAGRPDTVTESKLTELIKNGVNRICINPQTMKEATLEKIGRSHRAKDVISAFDTARRAGFTRINADLIAGLPDEDSVDFLKSLTDVIQLKPENITVHTLAVKRASKLKTLDENYSYRQSGDIGEMLLLGEKMLAAYGYRPYYLYRQKQMAGNLENVGYSFPGKENIYNIRIMEENQTILALGAGGISKRWYPSENRLERIPNVSNYEVYIDRIEQMIERKKKGIFNN